MLRGKERQVTNPKENVTMSTRSHICMRKKDGSYEVVYCHWDGYPSYNGAMLVKNYKSKKKVQQLIDLGFLSILDKEVNPPKGKEHSFSKPCKNVCVFYGRDRADEKTGKQVFSTLDEFKAFLDDSWCEYIYIFDESARKWECYTIGWEPIEIGFDKDGEFYEKRRVAMES